MAGQWGNTDVAGNSVFWATNYVNLIANTTNQSTLFNNLTVGAFNSGTNPIKAAIGQWGVSALETSINHGPVIEIMPATYGTGYTANTAGVTISANSSTQTGQNAAAIGVANTSGKISSYAFTNNGNTYNFIPTITVPAPAATTFNANTAVTTNGTITISSASAFRTGDQIKYYTAGGGTVLTGLANNTTYYVNFANSTTLALATTNSSQPADKTAIVPSATSENHTLQGITATAKATIGGGSGTNGVVHAGWVLRKSGTGGRAGRVTYETLVAMSSIQGTDSGVTGVANSVFSDI